MGDPYIPSTDFRLTDNERELLYDPVRNSKLVLTPRIIQAIILELIQNHFLTNNPEEMGYGFKHKYDPDPEKSQIHIDIGYNFKAGVASKRPAIFVLREAVKLEYPTMGMTMGNNVKESQEQMIAFASTAVRVKVIASPIGFAEELADFIRVPLMSYAQQIQKDFNIKRFRLVSVGEPELDASVDGKDYFSIELLLDVHYTDKWQITGDHLKLNTVSFKIFDSLVAQKPLENQ